MRKAKPVGPWVVYRKTIQGETAVNAVCEQAEWDAMELESPGHYTLIQAGIASEPEAERLARGTAGDSPIRLPRRV
jgi:hypothetical protein